MLATKFGHAQGDMGIADGAPKGSRAYIRAAVADSLRRLQTDHIDLYQLHTPDPVSYTHLDVYKRQVSPSPR